jgi:hypothetical protein
MPHYHITIRPDCIDLLVEAADEDHARMIAEQDALPLPKDCRGVIEVETLDPNDVGVFIWEREQCHIEMHINADGEAVLGPPPADREVR